jgi:hypothetical protein
MQNQATYVLVCACAMHRRAALCRIHTDFVVFGGEVAVFESVLQCGDRFAHAAAHLAPRKHVIILVS